jgi:hypothetical protein
MARIKGLLSIAIVVFGAYVLWLLLPPYYNSYQFQDFVDSEARLNSYNTRTEQEIQEGIVKKAQELDIPLTGEHVKVTKTGTEVTISAEYTIHVDLPLHPIDLHFTPASKNKRI